jgi:hypothetical protein
MVKSHLEFKYPEETRLTPHTSVLNGMCKRVCSVNNLLYLFIKRYEIHTKLCLNLLARLIPYVEEINGDHQC